MNGPSAYEMRATPITEDSPGIRDARTGELEYVAVEVARELELDNRRLRERLASLEARVHRRNVAMHTVALHLHEFCDVQLPREKVVPEGAKRARLELDRAKAALQGAERELARKNNALRAAARSLLTRLEARARPVRVSPPLGPGDDEGTPYLAIALDVVRLAVLELGQDGVGSAQCLAEQAD